MKGRKEKIPVLERANGLARRLLLAMCLFATASPAFAEEAPVWEFDFRDVFFDIVFLDAETAVIVGSRGRILVSHEKYRNLWSPRDSGTRDLLTCVNFVDERNGWAAGHGGTIVHSGDGGKTWKVQRESSPQNQPLFGIQFVSPRVGYACGAYDTFLKTTDGGENWRRMPTGFDNIFNGLAFLDEDAGYLVGEFGTVLQTPDGGNSWKQLELGGYQGSFFGITLLSREEILVYGISAKVVRSQDSGRTWEDVSPDHDQSLFRAAADRDHVVVVGTSGTLLVSADRGRTFQKRIDEDFTSFAGVCVHPRGGFMCVGERGKIHHLQVPLDPQGKASN